MSLMMAEGLSTTEAVKTAHIMHSAVHEQVRLLTASEWFCFVYLVQPSF